jgi:hypothetical protein
MSDWPYPWTREEEPDFIDPATGKPNRENPHFYTWFTAMREKYGYPRADHVADWQPRFKDWKG